MPVPYASKTLLKNLYKKLDIVEEKTKEVKEQKEVPIVEEEGRN